MESLYSYEGWEMINNSKFILQGWVRNAKISTDKKVDEKIIMYFLTRDFQESN